MRILLVEDNIRLSEAICEGLGASGFEVEPVTKGDEALAVAAQQDHGLIILDLGLPDAFDVLRELHDRKNALPVLVLTARDKLGGPTGASDLVSRLKDLLCVPTLAGKGIIMLNNLSFDPTNRQTKIGDETVELSRRETDLLEQLIRSIDKIVTKKSIETRLYSYDDKGSANSVEVLVHRLRKKLAAHAANIDIHTLRGIGYMITKTRTEGSSGN